MNIDLSNLQNKSPKKIALGLVPLVALGAGLIFGVEDVAGLEAALVNLVTAVATIIGAFGVVKNTDKSEKEKEKAKKRKENREKKKQAKG